MGEKHTYLSFSGGKDSTVLSHIARMRYPNILHVFAIHLFTNTLKSVNFKFRTYMPSDIREMDACSVALVFLLRRKMRNKSF